MRENITHRAPSKFAFACRNGVKVHSIAELLEQIKLMNAEEYSHFVHHGHNHFANWIEDIFELEDLPNTMRSVKTKKETIAVLEATLSFTLISTKGTKSPQKELSESKTRKHVNKEAEKIQETITHLHNNLHHMTKYDTHTPRHSENAGDAITAEIKDKLIDFGFGLIIGVVIGILIGRSLGVF